MIHPDLSMIPNLPSKFHGSLTPLTNALTNQIYKLETSNNRYLLRIFGPLLSRKYENSILQHLGKNGHPVKVEYVNKEYRIETWVEHTELLPVELASYNKEIAKRLAWYHTLKPPIDKTNVVLHSLLAMAKECDYTLPFEFLNLVDDYDMVLCHNDLQYGNILKTNEGIIFVDFEYSGYANREYDVANHFCEYMADYSSNTPELLNYSKYPSAVIRNQFYRYYLADKAYPSDSLGAQEDSSRIELFEKRVALNSLLSHLYWGVWGLYKSRNESRSFNYLTYGLARLERFTYLFKNKIGEGNILLLT
eukprot:NODE_57_length_25931_cov_0.351037.p12 type:complete len:306 gc:universal NODE_57_length_25931_cov_0.351037:1082-165(-)